MAARRKKARRKGAAQRGRAKPGKRAKKSAARARAKRGGASPSSLETSRTRKPGARKTASRTPTPARPASKAEPKTTRKKVSTTAPKRAPKRTAPRPAARRAAPAVATPAPAPAPARLAAAFTERIGAVVHCFPRVSAAAIALDAGSLRVGDLLHIRGHTTDVLQQVERLEREHAPIEVARAGDVVAVRVTERVREGDDVLRVRPAGA
jgi:putative protease